MKTKPILFFFLFSLLLANFFVVYGATLPHQGRVLISGKAFEGKGSFRFALADTAGNLVWNHQGTTGEPTTDLTLDIKGGFYSIALGDPSVSGMADLPASLFTNYAGLKLRIWFNDGTNGLQQLGTDQALLVAPYALSADSGSAQRIASLEASLSQALSRIATLEQPPNTDGSGSGSTGGPSQPGPSLPGEVAATSRSYIFVDGSAQYQEVTLPSAAQNLGKEYIVHSKISDLLVKGNKGEIDSKDYGLFNTASGTIPFSLTFVSNGTEWKITKPFGTVASGASPFGSGVFADIQKGTGSGSPSDFAVLGNHLYFNANDGINGAELWKTDGTVTGTMMVKDLNPGAIGSNPTGLTVFNNALYFAAFDAANGTELWKSDGTANGTALLKDITPGSVGSGVPNGFTVFNNALYFAATTPEHNTEMWKSDGTANGTMLFKDIAPGAGIGNPTNIRVDGNQLRFNAAQESWNSDGTLVGTVVQGPSFTDNGYVRLGNWYYYLNADNNGTELWRSDGSQNGAQLFKDIYPGSTTYQWPSQNTIVNSSNPGNFFLFNNTLYFSATDANGTELWKSDGTLAGTMMVKDLYPGSQYNSGTMTTQVYGSAPRNFMSIDNVLHFSATDANGTALWETDGTANGTVKLHSLPNLNGELIKLGNTFYYSGQGLLGAELYRVEVNGGPTSSTMFGSVNDLGANWKQSTWFGTYLDTSTNWIFHDALGWVYPVSSGGNGNWLYQSTLGWIWTNQSVYPNLYRNSSSDWILLNNQYYYSSSSSSWSYWGGGSSAPIEDYNASKTYAMGSLARVGQDSFMAIQAVPVGTSPPNTTYWTDLSVAATALGVPVESVPTLSTSTILASLPGSTPNTGGPSAPTGATHVVDLNSTVNLEMIRVEPGTFTMGSPLSEAGRTQAETEHNVTLTKPFYLGKYEVTQAQYESVMTGNVDGRNPKPSMWRNNPNRPVELVRWSDIQIFLSRLNASEQAAGRLPAGWSYVLPTEAEWEYACRAGTTTAYFWGDTITPNNANYSTSGIGQTTNVGQYASNPWGFYDMHGNVWEWSADWYAAYSTSQLVDPIGPYTGSSRIVRGGSYSNVGTYSRAAMRNFFPPDNRNEGWGFRLAFKQQ